MDSRDLTCTKYTSHAHLGGQLIAYNLYIWCIFQKLVNRDEEKLRAEKEAEEVIFFKINVMIMINVVNNYF